VIVLHFTTHAFWCGGLLVYITSRLYKVGLKFFTKPIDNDSQLTQLEVRASVQKGKKKTPIPTTSTTSL
jgi:hypothetical protein